MHPESHTPNPGVYVHIPFCTAICSYCAFNRELLDASLKRRYVDALVRDIAEWPERQPGRLHSPPDTLYLGGGTPSLLEPAEVRRLVETCRSALELTPDAEVTLEANPETLTPARLDGFRRAGVNRLSLGVQSFRDEELARLGRLHDARRAVDAFRWARSAGFENISLDLMMWLPEQTLMDWAESVDRLIELGPDHASLYLLEVYPASPLRDDMVRGGWSQAPDEDAAAMYELAMSRLPEAGLHQYEISNTARPGRESRHNLKYWMDGTWLAFGCGAHGTIGNVRWRNVAGTAQYIARVETGGSVVAEARRLDRRERLEEALFMGLRLTQGVDLDEIGVRYGVDVWAAFGPGLQPHLDHGLLERDRARLRLTRQGMLLANDVMAVFV